MRMMTLEDGLRQLYIVNQTTLWGIKTLKYFVHNFSKLWPILIEMGV